MKESDFGKGEKVVLERKNKVGMKKIMKKVI